MSNKNNLLNLHFSPSQELELCRELIIILDILRSQHEWMAYDLGGKKQVSFDNDLQQVFVFEE